MKVSLRKMLIELTSVLSERSEFNPRSTHDMRETKARKLKHACHTSHWDWGWERNGRYGRRRVFVSKPYCQALTLPDKEFNKLINALATIKKFNL